MRIQTSRGVVLLRQEIRALERQCQLCAREAARLSSFDVGQMAGKGASALTERVRAQAAVAKAHLAFCQSLLVADRRNLALLEGLPTTSPGTLDTDVANENIAQARKRWQELVWQRDEVLKWSRPQTTANRWGYLMADGGKTPLSLPYERLIDAQEYLIRQNERLIDQAEQYVRDAASLYRSVDTTGLAASSRSAREWSEGVQVSLGPWVQVAALQSALGARMLDSERLPYKGLFERYATGELSWKGALSSREYDASLNVLGIGITGSMSADVIGGQATLSPYGKGKREAQEDDAKTTFGTEAEVRGHVARSNVRANAGLVQGEYEVQGMSASAGATLGLSFSGEGIAVPSLVAKAEAGAKAFSAKSEIRLGVDDYNYHLQAKGDALTAESEASITLGQEGVKAKIGAEAYAATGEVTGGITFLGVKVDAAISAKAGGLGGKVAVDVAPSFVEGELGIGFIAGMGAKVKVDWGGALEVFARLGSDLQYWWNDLWERGYAHV